MDKIHTFKIQIIALIAVVLFFGMVLRLILKGKLRTEYSFIWIAMGTIFLVFSVWRDMLDLLAGFFGVYYAPSLIFMFFFFMIFIFLIHLSVVNSKQHEQIKKLTQEIALINEKILRNENKT
jgi:hypothetical protein